MSSRRDRLKKNSPELLTIFEVAGLIHGFGLVQPKTSDEEGHYVLHLSRKPTHDERVRLPTECDGFVVKSNVCPAI
jgi:hypothetical protein